MITYESFSDKTKEYYAVYIPPHDDVPHFLVPLEINFLGLLTNSHYKRYLRVVSSTRSTEYKCLVEDNTTLMASKRKTIYHRR